MVNKFYTQRLQLKQINKLILFSFNWLKFILFNLKLKKNDNISTTDHF